MDQQPDRRQLSLSFDPREQAKIDHARSYLAHFSHAGDPGHGQYLLIARLADLLSDAVSRFGYAPDADSPVKIQKVGWDDKNKCYRDLITGVKVELP